MKALRSILLSPLGLALTLVQWGIVAFAILGDQPNQGFNESTHLMYYLVAFNLPALAIGTAIGNLVVVTMGDSWAQIVFPVVVIPFITLQWLTVGASIEFFVSQRRDDKNCGLLA